MIHVQNDTTSVVPRLAAGLDRATPVLVAVAAVLVLAAPRAAQALLWALAALPVAMLLAGASKPRLLPLPPLMTALVAFAAYAAINATWSASPYEAYAKVAWLWTLIGAGYLTLAGTGTLDRGQLVRLSQGLLMGVAIGTLYLAIEAQFDQPIKKFLFSQLAFLRPSAKHARIEDGVVSHIGLYILNRSLALLCLLVWPALLLIGRVRPGRSGRWLKAGLVAATLAAVFGSEHETSMLAILFSCAVFTGLWLAVRPVQKLVVAGWLVATLLVVPIAALAYGAGLHQAGWIPETGRNRIILWGFTAGEIRKAPLLGIGVAATKELDEQAGPKAAKPADHSYALRTGRHSHNIYLQAWYELGAVGALLLAAIGWLVLDGLSRLPMPIMAYAYASFTAAAVIGAFSWGLWQTWFMAAFAVWAAALALAVETSRR